jgi:hypothetical protein
MLGLCFISVLIIEKVVLKFFRQYFMCMCVFFFLMNFITKRKCLRKNLSQLPGGNEDNGIINGKHFVHIY